jgi:aminopeptidase N
MRILLLFLVAEFAIMSSALASEKPFSFKDTPGKLPKEVVPTDYSVRIIPDIDKLTFAGTETVKLNVRSRVRQLVLNALELKIEAASIDGKELPASAIKIDEKKRTACACVTVRACDGRPHTRASLHR